MKKPFLFICIMFSACAIFSRKTIWEMELPHPSSTQSDHTSLSLISEGRELWLQDQASEAQLKFENALRISSDNAFAYFFLGQLLLEQKRFKVALGYFQRTRSLMNDEAYWLAQTFKGIGLSYFGLNQKNRAAQYFVKALALDPKDAEVENYVKQIEANDNTTHESSP